MVAETLISNTMNPEGWGGKGGGGLQDEGTHVHLRLLYVNG